MLIAAIRDDAKKRREENDKIQTFSEMKNNN